MKTYTALQADAIACLIDVAVDADTTAAVCPEKASPLGKVLLDTRGQGGSSAYRHELMALAMEVGDIWDSLSEDLKDYFSFDFEFCEWALEARYVEELQGDAFRARLVERLEQNLPPGSRYFTGERVQVGDVVQYIGPATNHICAAPGDVFTTIPPAGVISDAVWIDYGEHGKLWGDADQFALIARAGERVVFQTGDIVECIKASEIDYPGTPGSRHTVVNAKWWSLDLEERGGCEEKRFRLVHRPLPTTPPVGVPLTEKTAALLQPGDVLDITYGDANSSWRGRGVFIKAYENGFLAVEHEKVGRGGFSPKDLRFVKRPEPASWLKELQAFLNGECESVTVEDRFRFTRKLNRVHVEDLRA